MKKIEEVTTGQPGEADRPDIDQMMKSGDAFRFVSPFERSKAYEETDNETGETKKYVELFASSDGEDLVGDVMEMSALEDMESSAVGTIMLRDHNPSVEKIFGTIIEAKLVSENGKNLLQIKALVDDEDPQNIRIWKTIKNGTKLGASVTVVVTDKSANPRRKGSLIIKHVILLEISIVTIPCNQDSWTLAATASKALRRAEHALANKQKSIIPETGETMTQENQTKPEGETKEEAAAGQPAVTQTTEETTAEETVVPAEKGLFTRTLAAVAATFAAKKIFDEGGAKPEVRTISAKGMFAAELAKRKPSLWDLFDILCTVKWQLMDRKWAIEWTDLEDDFDYVGEFNIACHEFAEAAVESFTYYGGFSTDVDAALDTDGDGVTDKTLANAVEIEKSFQNLSELITQATDETLRKNLREIGASMLEVAKGAGIRFPESAVTGENAPAAVTDEEIRKSSIFIETEARAVKAESDLAEANQTVEAAKAGLEAANVVLKTQLRQPLSGTDASS